MSHCNRVGVICLLALAACGAEERHHPPPAGGGDGRFIAAHDGQLWLLQERFRFVGANRYDVASSPPGSGGFVCGNAYDDVELDRLMAELASTGARVLRLWAFQTFTRGATDWSTID